MPNDASALSRRPVSVVRAGGDPVAVAWRLAEGAGAPILPDDLLRAAAEQRTVALRLEVEAADDLRRGADAAVDCCHADLQRLVEGAMWCDERRGAVDGLLRAVTASAVAHAEAQVRLAAADAKVAEVAKQRAAAAPVLGEARRQLAELELAGTREEVARLASEVAAAETRLAQAEQTLVVVRAVTSRDPRAVSDGLTRLESAPLVTPDPDDLALADDLERLEAAVATGEAQFDAAHARLARPDERRRLVADLARVRAEAAARLGCPPMEVTPDALRRHHRDPAVAAELAEAMGLEAAPHRIVGCLARTWLAELRAAAGGLAAAEDSYEAAATDLDDRVAALALARTAQATGEADAAHARRQVEVFETELCSRVLPTADPATRVVTAAALRDRVGSLEARIAAAEAGAAEERAEAAATLTRCTGALADAQRAVVGIVGRMAALAQLSGAGGAPTGDLVADLAATADVLRTAAKGVADAGEARARAAADAAAAVGAARAHLDRHLTTPPGRVGPAALAAAVRLQASDRRTSDVLVEPLEVVSDDDARAAVLEALVDAGCQRPLVVVTDDPWLLEWASELPVDVGGLVSLDALKWGWPPVDVPSDSASADRRAD